MLNIGFAVTLETTTGFTLNTDQLDSAVLGYLETAVNASIRSADWSRGRDSMLDNFSAGSCRIVLDNRDRMLDPTNTSSALYGELYPGRKITLYMTQSKVREPVFSGYVDSWTYDYTLSGDATVTVNVLDAFSYLAQQTITSISAPEELSGARVNRVLSNIGWPLGKRAIDTGYSTLAAETITNVSVLDYLTKVAQSEFGMFYADRFGILQFRQRNRINMFSDLRVRNIPGDDSSYVEDIEFDYSFDRVFNSVTLTNPNTAVTASASNSASVTKYGQRSDEFDVLISNVTQMQSLASGIVNLYGVPDFIARRATINLNTVSLIVTSIENKDIIVRQYTVDVGYLTSVYWLPTGTQSTYLRRTNFVTNPSFEVNTTGWGITGTLTRITTDSVFGVACGEAVFTTGSASVTPPLSDVEASQTYTASAYIKGEAGKLFRIELREYASDGVTAIGTTVGSTITATGTWQRISISRTFGATGVKAFLIIRNQTSGAHTILIDGAMIEAASTAGSYFDGSTAASEPYTYAWSGTANASASYQYETAAYNGTVTPNSPIDIKALMITGIRYAATPGSIYVTLELDYAIGYDALILDDAVKGLLNTGKLGV